MKIKNSGKKVSRLNRLSDYRTGQHKCICHQLQICQPTPGPHIYCMYAQYVYFTSYTHHSISSKSCSASKNRLIGDLFAREWPETFLERFQSPKNILYVISILYSYWLDLSGDCLEQLRVQYCYDVQYILGFGTAPCDISVHTRANDSQASWFFDAITISW